MFFFFKRYFRKNQIILDRVTAVIEDHKLGSRSRIYLKKLRSYVIEVDIDPDSFTKFGSEKFELD